MRWICANIKETWIFAQSDEATSVELKLWPCEHTAHVLSSCLRPVRQAPVFSPLYDEERQA